MAKRGPKKKTLKDLPKSWSKTVLDLAEKGASDVEIRVALNRMSDDLWYRLIKESKTFAAVIADAHLLCQAWWEKQGRENINNGVKEFNATLWMMNMTNRFKEDWKHRSVHEHGGVGGKPIPIQIVDFSKVKASADSSK